MKKTTLFFLFILFNAGITFSYSQINKYGKGMVAFCVFDLEKGNVDKCSVLAP